MCIQAKLKVTKEGVERNLIGRDLNRGEVLSSKMLRGNARERGRSGKMSCICEVNLNNKKY